MRACTAESSEMVGEAERAPPPNVPGGGEWEARCCGLTRVYVAPDGRKYDTRGVELKCGEVDE